MDSRSRTRIDPIAENSVGPKKEPRKKRFRLCKLCCKNCVKLSLKLAVVLSVTYGITYAVLTTMYPELEPDDVGVAVQTNLTGLVEELGNLSAYAHVQLETDREPLVVVVPAEQDDDIETRHNKTNATTSDAGGDNLPTATIGSNETNVTHAMDIVSVSRVLHGGDNGSNASSTFVETVLRFDMNVSEYLASHPELLSATMPFDKASEHGTAGDASHGTAGDADASHGTLTNRPNRRSLGPHGADDRRSVSKAEARGVMPYAAVVRLKTRTRWWSEAFCSGVLIDDDTVLTAAHCVYKEGAYRWPSVEVHPWMAAHSPFKPSTWASGHADCANRARISYPCGTKWCRGWWGWWYPCGVHWCTRYASEPTDCTWRYSTRSIVLPDQWKATACQASADGTCSESDFQHDIALLKLGTAQGQHAGSRSGGVVTATHTDSYGQHAYSISGYPGDRSPFMATASGPIEQRVSNVLRHRIDANSGQSGSGVTRGSNVYGVHVYGGGSIDGARRIDSWWLHVLRSNF